MSINSATYSGPTSPPLLVAGPVREQLLCDAERVEMTLTTSPAPVDPNNYAFSNGALYTTQLRAIFVPSPRVEGCTSVVVPLNNARELKHEQPVFGANYLSESSIRH